MNPFFSSDDFFIAGGTLSPDAPSYVMRTADDELMSHVIAGDYCYVLTPRQMGKSSLMVRVAQSLRNQNISNAIVDLTQIGTESNQEEWYKGILTQIIRRLGMRADLQKWWNEKKEIPAIQKFVEFFDVALSDVAGQIVIFIDEIDTTLNLDFRDDFFAGIRSLYNMRAGQAVYKRLSFVLLGVLSPTDLISDKARTPFNIGHAISLQELELKDAKVLENGLNIIYPDEGKKIIDRVFYWTDGHPYLTQKLCKEIVEKNETKWDDSKIDALVKELFLSRQARKETNLKFIRDKLLGDNDHEQLLLMYKKILLEKFIIDNEHSTLQNKLKLSGIVKSVDSRLVVRNNIYKEAFGEDWVNQETKRTKRISTTGEMGKQIGLFINNPLLVGLLFSVYVVFIRFYIYPKYAYLISQDFQLIQSFIEWYGIIYGIIIALILVNVWSQFDALENEFGQEADSILKLYQSVEQVDNKKNEKSGTKTEIKERLIQSVKDYVSHVIMNYLHEYTRKHIRDAGDKALGEIRNAIGELIYTDEPEIILNELIAKINDAAELRANRIVRSKQRMPTPIWGIAVASSVIWLIPFYGLNFFSDWIAVVLVGGVTTISVAILVIVKDLDDPFEGNWKISISEWEFLREKLDYLPTLIFVYNADSNRIFKLYLFFSRVFSIRICTLYSLISKYEKSEFLFDELSELANHQIYYRDEFAATYEENYALPAVFYKSGATVGVLVNNDEIDNTINLSDLGNLIKERLYALESS